MWAADKNTLNRDEIWEDKWINTVCGGCYAGSAVRVRRVNGIAVAIEGHPDILWIRGESGEMAKQPWYIDIKTEVGEYILGKPWEDLLEIMEKNQK